MCVAASQVQTAWLLGFTSWTTQSTIVLFASEAGRLPLPLPRVERSFATSGVEIIMRSPLGRAKSS